MFNTLSTIPGAHKFSHRAMATIYEILIVHDDAQYARQAAHAAFNELDRLEQELSRFVPNSDISRINLLEENQTATVGLAAFECLQASLEVYEKTKGAFDVTVGPLLKCWQNPDKTPRTPAHEELEMARQRCGMQLLKLEASTHSVSVVSGPVLVDLGGIGKGYAVDQLAALLLEWDINVALIHGGASSVYALDAPAEMPGWPVVLRLPGSPGITLERMNLCNQALSGSGLQKGQHIIDPRTGKPVQGNLAAWICTENATMGDALSTTFMIVTADEIKQFCGQNQGLLALVVSNSEGDEPDVVRFGQWSTS